MNELEPAFPTHGIEGAFPPREGMHLRDWFAGRFLPGFAIAFNKGELLAEECASKAYELADAMLAQRQKPPT